MLSDRVRAGSEEQRLLIEEDAPGDRGVLRLTYGYEGVVVRRVKCAIEGRVLTLGWEDSLQAGALFLVSDEGDTGSCVRA
ncbi:hypothetical protein GCM10027599_23870 [Yimella radicis]